jgi:hypothetical protein
MNDPDHISEIRKKFYVKILNFFDAEPGWKKFGSEIGRIRDGKNSDLGSEINIPGPQHGWKVCPKQCCGSGMFLSRIRFFPS